MFTDAERAAILEAFRRKDCQAFGAERVARWIDYTMPWHLEVLGIERTVRHRSSRRTVTASGARRQLERVEATARALLCALAQSADGGTIGVLSHVSEGLAKSAAGDFRNVTAERERPYWLEAMKALTTIANRRAPPRDPRPLRLLPDLWDDVESLLVQSRVALQWTDYGPKRKMGGNRHHEGWRGLIVMALGHSWSNGFGTLPDARPRGSFVRVACAVCRVLGHPTSPPTVAKDFHKFESGFVVARNSPP